MRQNYLYKCTDCQTVKAIEEDQGQSTWALLCRVCGQVVTEHYRLDILDKIDKYIDNNGEEKWKWVVGCPKEKEDNGISKKEDSITEH